MAEIFRLIPADIYKIQQQTSSNAAVAQVIAALQSNVSTVEKPLNTKCPTCPVNGESTGLVNVTFQGNTYKGICPTCQGYLLYHTADGAETPPVNPFGDPITSDMLPADFYQALHAFNNVSTLDLMNTALQTNLPIIISNNCPLCTHTGTITVQSQPVTCTLCGGYQKTEVQYRIVDGVLSVVIPNIPPPDPIPPLPPIDGL